MAGAPVPPARQPVPGHDDALADAIAILEAYPRDDTKGIAAIPASASLPEVVITLAKLAAEAHRDGGCIASGGWREWAEQAVRFVNPQVDG